MTWVPLPRLGVIGWDEEVLWAGDMVEKLMAPGRWLNDRHGGSNPLLVT
jgi:hypothetical protein